MRFKRREFLEKTGLALVSLGMGGWGVGLDSVSHNANATPQVISQVINRLTQPTRRKLALLVGINQYSPQESLPNNPLQGCLTDVELQRELLIYRLGFLPDDILVLTDHQATRENIQNAFISHLQEQAKPDDIVVFHFSGYGSRIRRYDHPEIIQNSLIPVDDVFPTSQQPEVNDLLEETLILLLDSLPTDHAIGIFDTSYIYPGISDQGNFRIRSRARSVIGQQNEASFLFHQRLESQKLPSLKKGKKFPLILRGGSPSQPVAEGLWNGFSAGLLTYKLTQTLWEMTPTFPRVLNWEKREDFVTDFGTPKLLSTSEGMNPPAKFLVNFPDYKSVFLDLFSGAKKSADGGVIASEENGKLWSIWLGGLKPYLLDSYGINSVFNLISPVDGRENPSYQLQIRSRSGLLAKAQIKSVDNNNNLSDNNGRDFLLELKGQWLKESVRVIPRNINLTIAIDSHLERIERVDATSAFAGISQISPVIGVQPADYRFGRVMTTIAQNPDVPLTPLTSGRYGLFSLNQTLLPNSIGQSGEAIKVAIQRLTPRLKTLLAAKLLRLTNNENSSTLKVKVTLASLPSDAQRIMMSKSSLNWREEVQENLTQKIADRRSKISQISPTQIPLKTQVQYQIDNEEEKPLYWLIFALDHRGRALLINPQEVGEVSPENLNENRPEMGVILPGESQKILGWNLDGNPGLSETHVILNTQPFTQTLIALSEGFEPLRNHQSLGKLSQPLKIAQAILEDLQNGNQLTELTGNSPDDWTLNVKTWATLSFFYEVV